MRATLVEAFALGGAAGFAMDGEAPPSLLVGALRPIALGVGVIIDGFGE